MSSAAQQDSQRDARLHLLETVRLLHLAVAQIEASILESEKSFNRLAEKFTGIINTAQEAPDLADQVELLASKLQALQGDVHTAVMDFQFFDRLAQRLSHVKESLEELGDTLPDDGRVELPQTWTTLQENLKNRYTMACEREMFNMMQQGATVDEALAYFREHYLIERAQQDEDGEIDLF